MGKNKADEQASLTRLKAAFHRAGIDVSFLRYISAAMSFKITDKIPTIATSNRMVCYANPVFLQSVDNRELVGLAVHEMMHIFLDHDSRALVRLHEPKLWNIACDLEINSIIVLQLGDIVLPSGGVHPSMFELPQLQTAEQYLEMLVHHPEYREMQREIAKDRKQLKEALKKIKQLMDGTGEGEGEGEKQPGQSGGDELSDEEVDELFDEAASDHGSSTDNKPKPHEVPDGPPATKAERDMACEAGMQHLPQNIAHVRPRLRFKAANRVPAWIMSLKRQVQANTLGNQRMMSYKRPNRRLVSGKPGDPILPATIRAIHRVEILLDVSGSMDEHKLRRAVEAVHGLSKLLDVHVTTWDTAQVQARQPGRRFKLKMSGGGTNLEKGLRKLAEQPDCSTIVVVTDCYTPWPFAPLPGKEVIVVGIQNENPAAYCPPWMVVIDENGKVRKGTGR